MSKLASTRVDHVLLDVGLGVSSKLDLLGVLGGQHRPCRPGTGRLSASYSMVTWVLPSGAGRKRAVLADLATAARPGAGR
jgi:hypothetical protein